MRSIQDINMLSNYGQKFQSPKGDTTFTIAHVTQQGTIMFTVDVHGVVISPANTTLDYSHEDFMKGNQSGVIAKVKDFLTVTEEMDSAPSQPW